MNAEIVRQLVNKILHKNGTMIRKINRIEYDKMNTLGELTFLNKYKYFARSHSKFGIIVWFIE